MYSRERIGPRNTLQGSSIPNNRIRKREDKTMIIVSQEKNKIINFERITEITAVGKEIIVGDNIFEARGEIIAKYKTEERAKEVLQQIACRYSSEEMYKTADQKTKEEMTQIYVESEIVPYTFEMPEE